MISPSSSEVWELWPPGECSGRRAASELLDTRVRFAEDQEGREALRRSAVDQMRKNYRSRCSYAYAVAAARDDTPSLVKMLLTCRSTVLSLMNNSPAIDLFV